MPYPVILWQPVSACHREFYLRGVFCVLGRVFLRWGWYNLAWINGFIQHFALHAGLQGPMWEISSCNWVGHIRGSYVMTVHTWILCKGDTHVGVTKWRHTCEMSCNRNIHVGCYVMTIHTGKVAQPYTRVLHNDGGTRGWHVMTVNTWDVTSW